MQSFEILMKRFREDIIPLFKNYLAGEDAGFMNHELARCWKVLECNSTDCALFGNEARGGRCWQLAESCCRRNGDSDRFRKLDACIECEVFRQSVPTVVEEVGEYVNVMASLLNEQKRSMQEKDLRIERLQHELKTTLKQLDLRNKEVQEVMITDKVTGLFNRQYLASVMEDEIARCSRYGYPLAAMMIDIDGFRSVNEQYGQASGDKMLACAGALIRQNIRKFDRAFRYSGARFVVILPETDLTMAYIAAERLRKAFGVTSIRAGKKDGSAVEDVHRTVSIGITSLFPFATSSISIEGLLDQARNALEEARGKGGNMSLRYEQFRPA